MGVAFEQKGCLYEFVSQATDASNIAVSPWSESYWVPGTKVSTVNCKVRLPADVPNLGSSGEPLPQEVRITLNFRLCPGEKEAEEEEEVEKRCLCQGERNMVEVEAEVEVEVE